MFPSFVDFSFLLLCFFFFSFLCCYVVLCFCCSLSLIFLIGISMPAFMCAQAHVGSWLDGNFIYSTVFLHSFELKLPLKSTRLQRTIGNFTVTHRKSSCDTQLRSIQLGNLPIDDELSDANSPKSCKATNDDVERRNQRRIITITTIPSQPVPAEKYEKRGKIS